MKFKIISKQQILLYLNNRTVSLYDSEGRVIQLLDFLMSDKSSSYHSVQELISRTEDDTQDIELERMPFKSSLKQKVG